MLTLDQISCRLAAALRLVVPAALIAVFLYDIAYSWRWPVVWDSAVLHYVNFLIDHGFRPYRDISDSNMPGAYVIERWGMRLSGGTDLGWRFFDISLSLLFTLASIVIAGPGRRLAGLFGGLLFAILHVSEGPNFVAEREQVVTTLIAVALAGLLTSVRRCSTPSAPRWMSLFGLACGLATSVKPTAAPFALGAALISLIVLRRRGVPWAPFLLYAVLGSLLSAIPILLFFHRTHSFTDFLFVTRTLLPSYVSARQVTYGAMLRILLPRNLVLLLPFGILLALRDRTWMLEHTLVLAAALFGALSFFIQHKGLIYHRYPFLAFLLLLLGMEFFAGLDSSSTPRRVLACLGLLLTLGVSIPHYITETRRSVVNSCLPFTRSLTADLRALGPANLQRKVECFDLTDGCFSALLHLDVLQHDGFTGDLLFFSPTPSPVAEWYRRQFWTKQQAVPIDVIVLSNEWFQVGHTFRKLTAWPAFQSLLEQNYTEVASRRFLVPGESVTNPDSQPSSYRIYVRNSSPLLSHAQSVLH